MDAALMQALAAQITQVTGAAWTLERIDAEPGGLLLRMRAAEGTFTLEVARALPDRRCYRVRGEVAYSYRAGTTTPAMALLDRAIEALQPLLADASLSAAAAPAPAQPPIEVPLAVASHFPTPHHRDHLERTVALADEQIAAFRRDGHVLVRGAIDRGVLLAAREVVVAALAAAWARHYVPMEDRANAYARSFTQTTNLGLDDPAIRVLAHSRRIGKMAADLLGVSGVRIFCEDWLVKEPGADITPWHQDVAVMPFDAEATITVWIPLQPVTDANGWLRFARGSQRAGIQALETIDDRSEEAFAEIIRANGWPVDINPPMLVGDVSFHEGATVHGALPNRSDAARYALALHCFADGARLKPATSEPMRVMRELYAPDLPDGAPAATTCWPLVYRADDPTVGVEPVSRAPGALHLSATLLPGGAAPVDVWVQDGRLRFAPVPGAVDAGPAGGFLTSGLVDCHSHLSWPHTPDMAVDAQTLAFMNANRAAYARTGVLVVRDMGSASDHISLLGDQPGLPRVHPAGRLVVPYDGFPFTATTPAGLARTFVERLERGASWIKVFTDWSDDWGGQMRTGFFEDNPVTYPLPALREAVDAVHRAGGRVAAHCFTHAGAEVAIRAGVDSIEHGWGIDAPLVEEMAARGIGWVPLVAIASVMWRDAARDRKGENLAWIERSLASLKRLLPYAHARGVPVLAGTDWFPDITVADEIRELAALDLEPATAVAAGAWAARRWLGEPGLEEGAPADLVLYDRDPRQALDALDAPALVLSGGVRVAAAPLHPPGHFVPLAQRIAGTAPLGR